jgi:ATP-dependent Clp protease protease subunit
MKKFYMKGVIVSQEDKWIYDFFGMTSVTPEEVIAFLDDANGEEIKIYIDSPGGLITAGSDIYSALREYEGESTSFITGWAASAASWAMLGTKKVIASPTARFMYHNAQGRAEGDYRDMEAAAGRLKNANNSFINAYQIKTGKSRDEIQAMLDKDTFHTAQEALEFGFVDEIALKDGEELEPLIAAAIGGININKMHELAMKYKDKPNELLKHKPDSGGNSGPATDVMDKQKTDLNKIRKKILNRATADMAVF